MSFVHPWVAKTAKAASQDVVFEVGKCGMWVTRIEIVDLDISAIKPFF
jgi:hypothetical protein